MRRHTALITGATAGIGAELARQLAAKQVNVVLVARTADRLEALAAELSAAHGVTAAAFPCDLADPDDLERLAERVADAAHPIDILVNNAGFGIHAQFESSAVADERRLFEVLAWAPVRLSHAAVPGMLERGHGWILNVASVAAFTPTGTYGAVKAAVVSLSRSLNARYRSQGLHVTALCPGMVRTEFHERMGADGAERLPSIAWADARAVARDGIRALRRGRSVVVADWRYRLLQPLVHVLPDRLTERVSSTAL
ncbi:SDR family NAD(P)-dependent oxidoreductase [Agrococcus casei]|uniref:SDR family NAD(P)-dependent oxidoreductase n=1 Tax=Agrococcus casei TaxID=343512 RepID=UPI003F9E03A7